MRGRRLVAVYIAAGAGLAANSALGQTTVLLRAGLDETVPVATIPTLEIKPLEEPQPPPRKRTAAADPYAPVGVRLGGLILFPSVTVGSVASSNIGESASREQAAAGLRLKPALRFESDWVRHSWTGEGSGDFIRYFDHGDFASNKADLFSKFRLDIRHDTRAEFDTSYGLDQSGIGSSDVPATAIGDRVEHTISASAALIQDFEPMQLRLRNGLTRKIFEDVDLAGGGTEDNSDRNYVEDDLSLRATYSDPPLFKPFVETAYQPREYDRQFDRNGIKRSSQGYSASLGVEIDRAPLWTGELAATYLRRIYDDPALSANDTVGLTGNLTWSPNELTKIVVALDTSLTEDVATSSSGGQNWTGRADITHALRDNVDLLVGAAVEIDKRNAGTDVTYDASLGLQWKLSPSLAWTASYDATWLNAAAASRDYAEHRLTLGLTLSR